MKKLYFLIIILFSLQTFSQKDYSRYYNSWRLGLNVGGAWQTADYRSCWGMAGGITLEKGLHENSTNIFSFAIRGRYLGANTYGMDYHRNYGIHSNPSYNGTYDPAINFSDTARKGRGYVYDNYKMKLGEGSLELQLTFNRLRERTHVLLNLWGGVGFTSFRTKSDLLDANGMMYDFNLVDSTGNKTNTINTYNALIDKKYESYAYGSKNGNLITFSPSAGIGLGYQISPGFSMLWEYKVTFPQGANADLLDGKLAFNNDAIGRSNDYYHYTGLNLVFTLRGKHKHTNTTTETVNTNTTVTTNTVATTTSITPTPTIATVTPTVVTTPPPTEPKPVITFITPPVSGHIVTNQQYKISAQILNVANANQIQLKFNGFSYTNFTFNAQSHILEYNATLNTGNNTVQIVATNAAGSDNKSTIVVYELPKPTATPPVVTYINPVQPGTIVSLPSYIVKAQVLNVGNQSGISIYVNGMSSPFTFNNSTKQVTFTVNLNPGKNTISITGNNPVGEDTKVTDITYQEPQIVKTPPVITITNPVTSPVNSPVSNYAFKANVTNITSKSQLVVKVNGIVTTAYAFNMPTIICPAALVLGNNTFEVTATNNDGSDVKTAVVNYKPKVASGPPPMVSLINPVSQINATDNLLYNFKLSVLNVASQSDIELLFNGVAQTNFTYDAVAKEVYFHTNLVVGDNTVSVKGTNQFGVDSKTINVNYQPHADIKLPPVIAITNPSVSPKNVAVPNMAFKATVSNITSKSQLVVKVNGNVTSAYAFNMPTIICPATLIAGNNTFEVTATNNDGSDSKSAIVDFRPKAVANPPVVSLINPPSQINATDNLLYNFKLSVLHVASQSNIELLFNGVAQSNFTYDAATKEVFFQTNLVVGDNTVLVKATNTDGVDSKTINVNYQPHADIKLPPMITFINPNTSPISSQSPNYVFNATVGNMPNTNGLVVKYNNVVISNYTYDGFNLSYSAALTNNGANTLEISATNNDGNDMTSSTVIFKPKVIAKPPVVTIDQPKDTPTVTSPNYNFMFKAFNVSKNQIEVKLNGIQVSQFNYVGSIGTFTANLDSVINTLSVKATNDIGSVIKSEVVIFKQLPIVNESDTIRTANTLDNGDGSKTMIICHHEANKAAETVKISPSQWYLHEGHGDTKGECPAPVINPIKINPKANIGNQTNETKPAEVKQDTLNKQPLTPRRPR